MLSGYHFISDLVRYVGMHDCWYCGCSIGMFIDSARSIESVAYQVQCEGHTTTFIAGDSLLGFDGSKE